MPKGTFDSEGFFVALDGHRVTRRKTWKQVADESHVSASTLTRMAQGKRPDVDSLSALLVWSGESVEEYILTDDSREQRSTSSLATAMAQFRRDPKLSAEGKKAIEATLKALYQQFAIDPDR